MARAPGEAGRDGANHVVTALLPKITALLPKILDKMRTDPWVAALFSIATTLAVAAFAHRRELILLFLVFVLAVLAVLAVATFVFNHRREKPPGIGTEPDKADKAARSARADPSASPLARAVSVAERLQRQGNIEKALEKRRAIANVADGTDDELGARAWFSIGYLHGKESRHQKAVDAYDKAIRRKPGMAEAYHNRGVMKRHLRRYEDAVADYDEAIKRDPNYAKAYYNRAKARFTLGYKDEALRDFETARALARAAGDKAIADRASRQIERLSGGGDP